MKYFIWTVIFHKIKQILISNIFFYILSENEKLLKNVLNDLSWAITPDSLQFRIEKTFKNQ